MMYYIKHCYFCGLHKKANLGLGLTPSFRPNRLFMPILELNEG
jgi:hypothetical protein